MESKKNCEKKCPRYEHPKTIHTYIEYCAMENCGGKIKFMIRSGGTFPAYVFFFF
jgi:hypothetical protein